MFIKKENNRALVLLATCLSLSYLLPFHVTPFRAFFTDWLAILGLVVVIAYCLEEKSMPISLPWIAIIPFGLATAIVLQTAMGMLSENWDAFLPVVYLLLTAVSIMLGASLAARQAGAAKLCMALAIAHLVAGMVSVVIASLQFIGAEIPFAPFMMLMLHKTGSAIRPYANLGQTNHLALLFCLSIASAWWLYQAGRIKSRVAIGIVVWLLWGLVLTQSRIGWIILPLFAFPLWFWRSKVGFKPVSGWLILGLLLSYFALVSVLPGIASALNVPLDSPIVRASFGNRSERMALFEEALKISLAHPWFGAGWFQFGPQQVMAGLDYPSTIYSHYAHNIVLNFAAELGWPITVLVFGVLAIWFFRSCISRPISIEVGFSVLFFLAVLVHSMVEYPLWYAFVLLPVSLLIGMVHYEQFGSTTKVLPRPYLLALVFLMVSGLVGVGMDYRRVVAGFQEVEFEAMGVIWDKTATQKPDVTIFPYMFDYFRFLDMTVHGQMSPEEIAFMERVTKRFGGVLPLTRMSQVYALNGREDDAVKSVLAVQRLHGARRYKQVYEDWRRAPQQYQTIFKRLPPPG
jgi:O-antigen ligase